MFVRRDESGIPNASGALNGLSGRVHNRRTEPSFAIGGGLKSSVQYRKRKKLAGYS